MHLYCICACMQQAGMMNLQLAPNRPVKCQFKFIYDPWQNPILINLQWAAPRPKFIFYPSSLLSSIIKMLGLDVNDEG